MLIKKTYNDLTDEQLIELAKMLAKSYLSTPDPPCLIHRDKLLVRVVINSGYGYDVELYIDGAVVVSVADWSRSVLPFAFVDKCREWGLSY